MSSVAPDPAVRGRLISFEGGDGAGKTTQIGRLARRLAGLGQRVVSTREPGGSPRAERLRAVLLGGGAERHGPFAEAALFAAARADHVDSLIRPALDRGCIVLCDRFVDSTRVYQGDVGRVPGPRLAALEAVATRDVLPDLTIVLDVPAATGRARVAGRQVGGDRFEAEGAAFQAKVREAFRQRAEAEPGRCALVDGSAPPDEVEAAIWQVVSGRGLLGDPARAA